MQGCYSHLEGLCVLTWRDADAQGAAIMPISGVIFPPFAASFLLPACCLAVLQGAEQLGRPIGQNVDGH
jgi:hypothetical protein